MKGRIILGISFVLIGIVVWLVPYARLQSVRWVPLRVPIDLSKPVRLEKPFDADLPGTYFIRIRPLAPPDAGAAAGAPGVAQPIPWQVRVLVTRGTATNTDETVSELKPSSGQTGGSFTPYTVARIELSTPGRHKLTLESKAPLPQLAGLSPGLEVQCSRALMRERSLHSLIGLLAGVVLALVGLLLLAASWIAHKVEYAGFD